MLRDPQPHLAETASCGDRRTGRCYDDPTAWDLDSGGLQEWAAAITRCRECPLLAQCRGLLEEHYPYRYAHPAEAPHGVIWAGEAYDDKGQLMTMRSMRYLDSVRARDAARQLGRAS